LVENRYFSYPLAFDALVRGVPVGILPSRLYGKTRVVGLPDGVRKEINRPNKRKLKKASECLEARMEKNNKLNS